MPCVAVQSAHVKGLPFLFPRFTLFRCPPPSVGWSPVKRATSPLDVGAKQRLQLVCSWGTPAHRSCGVAVFAVGGVASRCGLVVCSSGQACAPVLEVIEPREEGGGRLSGGLGGKRHCVNPAVLSRRSTLARGRSRRLQAARGHHLSALGCVLFQLALVGCKALGCSLQQAGARIHAAPLPG